MKQKTHIKLIAIFLLTTSHVLFSQVPNKRYVEEIALYHLDSLIKVDPVFKKFKYFTNGYLSPYTTEADTNSLRNKPPLLIKSSFKNLQIMEDLNIVSFSVPRRIRRNGSSTILNIFHFTKIDDKYWVLFTIDENLRGQKALIIMNTKGDLIGRKYSTYIY